MQQRIPTQKTDPCHDDESRFLLETAAVRTRRRARNKSSLEKVLAGFKGFCTRALKHAKKRHGER